MAFFASRNGRGFDGVALEKLIKIFLITPASAVVVKLEVARTQVRDHGVTPFGKFDPKARFSRVVKLERAAFGGRQVQPFTSCLNRRFRFDFSFDLNDVRQGILSIWT